MPICANCWLISIDEGSFFILELTMSLLVDVCSVNLGCACVTIDVDLTTFIGVVDRIARADTFGFILLRLSLSFGSVSNTR